MTFDAKHRTRLQSIASVRLGDDGFLIHLSPEAKAQLKQIQAPAPWSHSETEDMRSWPWVSVDNDDSRDLDQLNSARRRDDGSLEIAIAIADVDALVPLHSPLDEAAAQNTTSIYIPGHIFPMLPEKLSCDLTSLNEHEDRLAVVTTFTLTEDGELDEWHVGRAMVRNHAQLEYESVGAWLMDCGAEPPQLKQRPELAEALRWQDEAAQAIKRRRMQDGALELETLAPHTVFHQDYVKDLVIRSRNHATDLIENLMIATNRVAANFLDQCHFPSLRRIVRSPERWRKLTDLAADKGGMLPPEPDSLALQQFLINARMRDAVTFPDLSLAVVKLLGRGEYVAVVPGEESPGHFGLAIRDYAHSTAPNRRYPDLITQRLLKAAMDGEASPYSPRALEYLAGHCTERESSADKVERHLRKSAAALLLSGREGELFEAIVTGSNTRGTWVRCFKPPVEGKLIRGNSKLKVGARILVKLEAVDPESGHIDFIRD